jgi:hypothetical protein
MSNNIELAQNEDLNKSIQVFDAELQQIVEVSTETRQQAMLVHNKLTQTLLMTAFLLEEIAVNKLYLGLGCSSFSEYVGSMTPFSETKASKLRSIGQAFSPIGKLSHVKVTESKISEIESLGLVKLYDLSKAEDVDFSEVESGYITFPSGRKMSLEELKTTTRNELRKELAVEKSLLKAKIELLDEDKKAIAAELSQYKENVNNAVMLKARADEIFRMYGDQSSNVEKWSTHLNRARTHLQKLNQELYQIEVGSDVPEFFIDELQEMHKSIDRAMNTLRERNPYAFGSPKIEDEVEL